MLNVTDAAGAQLKEMIDEATSDDDTETAVRFTRDPRGLVMNLDKPKEGDTKIEHDGRVVVLLEQDVSQALQDKTLGVKETEKGQALIIN